jgi:4-hydroxybenzoyl-CoA thioesterase
MNPLAFVHRRRVKWGEADVAGAVDLSTLIRYTMEATEEWFLEKVGVDWNDLYTVRKIATGFARMEINFHRPVRASENLKVLVTAEELGPSSVIFQVMGHSQADVGLCWDGRLTCIFADAQTLKPIPIPEPFRQILRRESELLLLLNNPGFASW